MTPTIDTLELRKAIRTELSLSRIAPHVYVDDSRDDLLSDFAKATLDDRYVVLNEGYQDRFANAVAHYSNDEAHANRMYGYLSKLWCLPATPILSNGGTTKGNNISCYLSAVEDSLGGIVDSWVENIWLAAKGGGLGIYYGDVRAINEPIGLVGKTSGALSFVKVTDSLALCISQANQRRGSAAIYMDISHPEVEAFLEMRMESGGDPSRKALNLHHGILIPDAFYEACKVDGTWDLISPKSGMVLETVSARSLMEKLLMTRMAKGEPYIVNIDTVNRQIPKHHKLSGLKVTTSNLCVAGETRLLTNSGYKTISEIAGSVQYVWNGKEFAIANIQKTGENQKLIKVIFSNGVELNVTPYHRFKIQDGYGFSESHKRIVEAQDLVAGDKIVKMDLPVITAGLSWDREYAYCNGFYTADGTDDQYGNPRVYLYGEKKELVDIFVNMEPTRISLDEDDGKRHTLYFKKGTLLPKYTVPLECDITAKLAWLGGYLYGDGTVARNGVCENIQVSSVNKPFLHEVRLLLNTLGINAHIALNHISGLYPLPDGRGGTAMYDCQPVYRLCITAGDTQRLITLGLPLCRLNVTNRPTQRDAQQFIQVVDVVDEGRYDDTYCFNEPNEHMGVFEGIPTMNCSEIVLPTGRDHHDKMRTAVCALFQTNFETYEEWKDDPLFIEDIAYFMDNVLTDYIENAGDKFKNATYSAYRERSIGIGMMGFHSFLQKKNIPFESAIAKAWNMKYFKHLREGMDKASVKLAHERGACPDALEHGIMERFSCKLALAPTASVSVIANTSAGGDPIPANIYSQKTLAGTFEVRNKYLEKIFIERNCNTDEIWKSISDASGSVYHLTDVLSEHEINVFKTAFEIDPRWVIEHAADRTPYICQAQSTNLWLPADISKKALLALHMLGWEKGLKSWYYLRSLSVAVGGTSDGSVRTRNVYRATDEEQYELCLACQ